MTHFASQVDQYLEEKLGAGTEYLDPTTIASLKDMLSGIVAANIKIDFLKSLPREIQNKVIFDVLDKHFSASKDAQEQSQTSTGIELETNNSSSANHSISSQATSVKNKKDLIDADVKTAVEDYQLILPLTDKESLALEGIIDERGIMGKNSRFPDNVQSHPLVLLRIPLFVATSSGSSKKLDLTNEEVGVSTLRSFSALGYEGFNSVYIEGPTMSSLHFLVWDAIIRCYRQKTKAELIVNKGVVEISFSRFMEYMGISSKNKRTKVRDNILSAILDIKKQVMVITGKQGKDSKKEPAKEPAKEAAYNLINTFVIDEKNDLLTFSVSKSFFELFGDNYLIPVDINILSRYKSEVLRVALIFLNSLPAAGNKHLKLKRIVTRVRGSEVAVRRRDYHLILDMMNDLKELGRVDFTISQHSEIDDITFTDFSHTLQRKTELTKPVLKLNRKPRVTKDEDKIVYNQRLCDWVSECFKLMLSYAKESGDSLCKCTRMAMMRKIYDVAVEVDHKSAIRFVGDIIKERNDK
ncbi:hypothetical protein LZ656_20175 [Leclercia adecarboxylata]|uniref:hypothetical protein n=1 Tax=Leclercia adecarboxylata TaxID=83655 RepID=UPI001F446373|nr:hypothetical protein [Leclercia adecarboxylata]MCE9984688.1 hypothetical protein [Leclercia adecarboxylata]MDU1983689.1 hypothetical protein [Streptococcus parasanguinis]